jgi:nitrite reductase/ring-hydroxylating ferredoxin subunit
MLPQPERLTTVVFDGTEIVIANVNGQYHAIDGLCEHAGGPLGAGKLIGCHLTCPLHAWTYDVTDGWLVNPALGRRTKSFHVRVTGDIVEVAPQSQDVT